MKIKDKKEFASLVNALNFRYAKTFTNSAPHEYAMGEENTQELEIIRALNRYIQEKHDEIKYFGIRNIKLYLLKIINIGV